MAEQLLSCLIALLIGGLFVWAGLSFMRHGLREFRIAIQSKNWIAIPAVVERYRVVTTRVQYTKTLIYWYVIVCGYEVQGCRYENGGNAECKWLSWKAHSFYIKSETEADVQALSFRDYPIGRSVKLFYNPRNPKESTSSMHHPWSGWIAFIGLAISFVLSGTICLIIAILSLIGKSIWITAIVNLMALMLVVIVLASTSYAGIYVLLKLLKSRRSRH